VFYEDAASAIDWLCRAFGFEARLRVEGKDGRIEHSELVFGEGLIMVGSAGGKSERPVPLPCKSPRALGGANTQSLCVYVDEVDAHCRRREPRVRRSWRSRPPTTTARSTGPIAPTGRRTSKATMVVHAARPRPENERSLTRAHSAR